MMKQNLILAILVFYSLVSVADEYSDALDAEANGTTVIETKTNIKNEAAIKAQNDWSFTAQSLLEDLPPNLPRNLFETSLKDLYYGSYVFYSKLKPEQSENVYKAYIDGMEIEKLRSLITKKYKNNF